MNNNIFSYYSKTLLKILSVIIFAYCISVNCKTSVDTEILSCSKSYNKCYYKSIRYNGSVEKDVVVFSPLDITKIDTDITSHTRHGRRGRVIVEHDYLIKLYMSNGDTIVYPISSKDYNDLQNRFNHFSLYLRDTNQINYEDTKYNDIDTILIYLYIFFILVAIVILILDIRGWKKLISYNYHNNSMITRKVKEFFDKGEAVITIDDLNKDFELYKKWEKSNPEEWKREQEELAKLSKK
jgi:hypothetical protein